MGMWTPVAGYNLQKPESYSQRVDGVTIKELVDNWVKDLGNVIYIGY